MWLNANSLQVVARVLQDGTQGTNEDWDYCTLHFPHSGNVLRLKSSKNNNGNDTNQRYDWLNEEKQSFCTCATLFGAILILPKEDSPQL